MKESKVYQKKERLYLCDCCTIFDRWDYVNWSIRTETPFVQEDTKDNKTYVRILTYVYSDSYNDYPYTTF